MLNFLYSSNEQLVTVGSTVALILILIFLRLLRRPLNRIRYLGDVGYGSLRGRAKARIVRSLQKNRKIGRIPPVYPNGWFSVAESRDLKPGDVKSVNALGQQIVVFRSRISQKAHVLDAHCPHMGANLGMGGQVVEDKCIQCPFHGWILEGEEGSCVTIPYSSQAIPKNARVKAWQTREVNQHIYIWYHCDGEVPDWEIPELPELATISLNYGGRTEHHINCHIEEIPENGADVAHLNFLHGPNIVLGNDMNKIRPPSRNALGKHVWEAKWEPQSTPNQHRGVMELIHNLEVFGFRVPGTTVTVKANQIGPGIVYLKMDFGLFGHGLILQHLTPEAPLHQRLIHQIYTGSRFPRIFAKLALLAEAFQVERDVMMWNNKIYRHNPILVREENLIARHRRWYAQFFTENSPRLSQRFLLDKKNGEDLF